MMADRQAGPDGRPHVMRIYSRLDLGGIERQMLRLLPRLNAGRYRVSLCLLQREGALADELRASGVPVHVLPIEGRLKPRGVRALARLLRDEGVSIAHAHVREANTTATVAARLAGVPVVIATIHNMASIQGRRRILQDRLLDRWRDAVVCVSERVKEDYCRTIGVRPEKVEVIYNGLDLERFVSGGKPRGEVRSALGLAPDDRLVLTVARLHPQKAHEVLIEAAGAVTSACPSARFALAGEGPRRAELERLVRDRGLAERFLFLGSRADVADLCRAADVACLSSVHEGFSNVVLECLASGLPFVATDVGGNREAIQEGLSGYLVPPGDAAGIARRLIELLTDDALRARMAEGARARSRRFSLEETQRATEALYDRLLAAKGAAAGRG